MVQAFHDKHQLRQHGGEDLPYRIALMAEELGEISACVTKGKTREALAEDVGDGDLTAMLVYGITILINTVTTKNK